MQIQAAYVNAFQYVSLSGPTLFRHIVNGARGVAAQFARRFAYQTNTLLNPTQNPLVSALFQLETYFGTHSPFLLN